MPATTMSSKFISASRDSKRIRKLHDSSCFRVTIGRFFLLVMILGGATATLAAESSYGTRSSWETQPRRNQQTPPGQNQPTPLQPDNPHFQRPSSMPSYLPTGSSQPTNSTAPSESPSVAAEPSQTQETKSPVDMPSSRPSLRPSANPSFKPSRSPTVSPVEIPSFRPSQNPSGKPSVVPSQKPSAGHSSAPTESAAPSVSPSRSPSWKPSHSPSQKPSAGHSSAPTESAAPSVSPSLSPSWKPSHSPTKSPSNSPSVWPSPSPSVVPSNRPSGTPSVSPTVFPSLFPTEENDVRTLTLAPIDGGDTSDTRMPQDDRAPTYLAFDDDLWGVPVSTLPPQPDVPSTPTNPNSFTAKPNPSPSDHPLPTLSPSQIPSDMPSIPPSMEPTRKPAPNPTNKPTGNPTISSTSSPTFDPSAIPTRAPTKSPTRAPTKSPTRAPTKSPTRAPTKRPTSLSPTNEPTLEPTKRPSSEPTPSPTAKPSPVPSPRPTRSPTLHPTPHPTPEPTMTKSADPTPSGTLEPTLYPTQWPTLRPTESSRPSASPTTSGPTQMPSPSPTTMPSHKPTDLPSSTPSSAPSLPPQSGLVVALMSMSPYLSEGKLIGQAIISWESATERHIKRHILRAGVEPQMIDLQVRTNIVDQHFPKSSSGRQRLLQEVSDQALIIQFDVALDYRSVGTDHDLKDLVFSAWDIPMDRAEYVMELQSESDVFFDIEDVLVEVDGYSPPPIDDDDDTSSESVDIAVIAGASVGGAALIILIVCLLMRRRNGKGDDENNEQSRTTPDTAHKIAVATEILVEPQDDVSTLGDPMFAPGGMLMGSLEKDEVTASVGDDYDYTRQYRHTRNPASVSESRERDRLMSEDFTKTSSANSTTMSKLGRMGESLFADDASFEQQFDEPEQRFDVVAPAGKLGMVIDTPNGGVPVVHAIKDTSVLVDRVRVGDRLLSVDGEDCTAMTAMQVSKLISLKSEKPARVLMFARSRANATDEP